MRRYGITPRVYFEGWYDGVFAKAEDWYKDGVIYVNLKHYRPGAALSRPTKECYFLVRTDAPERFEHYPHSIVTFLLRYGGEGNLIPVEIKLPEIDLC